MHQCAIPFNAAVLVDIRTACFNYMEYNRTDFFSVVRVDNLKSVGNFHLELIAIAKNGIILSIGKGKMHFPCFIDCNRGYAAVDIIHDGLHLFS